MQDEILAGLEDKINEVRLGPALNIENVISALDDISKRIEAGEFDTLIGQLDEAAMYKEQAIELLSREGITARIKNELGDSIPEGPESDTASEVHGKIRSSRVPLGTIFHIAAGNADVLPAYSLIEGLICGNVNILKLPEADDGLTVMLLKMLTDALPEVAGYIHVFDTPSSDIAAMKKMADMADAISIWGGDPAISAVRQMASSGCELIEWGHKLSFCYISSSDITAHDEELKGLARHIFSTKQLLCSSCQVIYLDTDDIGELDRFCEHFIKLMEQAAAAVKISDIGAAAEAALRKRCEEIDRILEEEETSKKRFSAAGCSLLRCSDSELEISELWGNCLVKGLPKGDIINVLRKKKGYLQTAGLITDGSKEELTQILIKCGINRVLKPSEMSVSFPCESHDGKYPFERYTRVVNYL